MTSENVNTTSNQSPMILLSRKGQNKHRDPAISGQTSGKTQDPSSTGHSASGSAFPSGEAKRMGASVVFVNDLLEIAHFIQNHLHADNNSYTVVGAIGIQGTGKSTLLSMLAGNQPLDKYRQYIFRPCSRDTIYSGLYQTNGIHIYVSETRVIYMDCKAFNCSAVFEEQIRKAKSDGPSLSIYRSTQVEGLTLLGLMFELCDTLIFNIDWFIDINAVQEVLRAAFYSEFNFRRYSGYPKITNLVVVHQRAHTADFEMYMVKKRASMIRTMFKDSGYDVNGGISMANLGFTEYADCEPDVNYIVMNDLPQWTKEPVDSNKLLTVSYENVLRRLRPALQGLVKHNFRTLNKMRPLRRHGRKQKLNLPPTLDRKRAIQLKAEELERETLKRSGDDQEQNGNADDEKLRLDFNPDHMPNITRFKASTTSHEPWHESISLSVLSPPESCDDAFKSLSSLLAAHSQRNDYVDLLLSSVVDQPRHTESQWLDYAKKILEVTKKAYATKYFISNNGRIAPRLLRKLPNATKLVYIEAKALSSASTKRKIRGRGRRTTEQAKEEGLADALNEVNIMDSEEPDEDRALNDETINLEEQSFNAEEFNEKGESSEDNLSSEFDDTSSDDDSAQSSDNQSSESSDDESVREKNVVRRTTRRRRVLDED